MCKLHPIRHSARYEIPSKHASCLRDACHLQFRPHRAPSPFSRGRPRFIILLGWQRVAVRWRKNYFFFFPHKDCISRCITATIHQQGRHNKKIKWKHELRLLKSGLGECDSIWFKYESNRGVSTICLVCANVQKSAAESSLKSFYCVLFILFLLP